MQSSQIKFASKAEARAHFKEIRASLTPDERRQLDERLCASLADTLDGEQTVLMFYPAKGEPDILPIASRLISQGVRVAFPISLPDTCELDFRYVDSLDDMSIGTYGIHEPPRSAQGVSFPCECVCVVPGLAFDMHGMRIGYGKGYYDRFLAANKTRSIGVAYSVCTCRSLPVNNNDICVDTIITEKGVLRADEDRAY